MAASGCRVASVIGTRIAVITVRCTDGTARPGDTDIKGGAGVAVVAGVTVGGVHTTRGAITAVVGTGIAVITGKASLALAASSAAGV
jgi:hypothetical protein